MKKLYTLLLLPFLALGQSQNQNHIRTTTYKVATGSSIPNPSAGQAAVQVSYFDGLGRPIQQVAHKQASNGGDIIVPVEYDAFGRQVKEYLPYVRNSNSKDYDASGLSNVMNFYATNNVQNTGNPGFASTLFPYGEKQLEASPLGRVFKQSAPGEVWKMGDGKEIKFDYQTNSADEVRYFKATATWNTTHELYDIVLTDNTFYSANELYKTITKDENWTSGNNNTTEEFKNKQGQVVLKRTYSDVTLPNGTITQEVKHDTYYVYDDYGNLTYVIPPLVNTTGAVSTNDLTGLCYQYKYDYRNRLVEKKLPGKDWEYIVYDKLDRPVYTGPTLNPFYGSSKGWNITKYDVLGRVVYTGWMADGGITSPRRKQLQGDKNSETTVSESKTASNGTIDGITIRYSNSSLPNNSLKLLTINYYDTYSYPNGPSIPSSIFGQVVLNNAKGLATGAWVRVLNLTGTPVIGEHSYSFYDSKGRVISSSIQNHLNGYTQIDMQLDFAGQVLATTTSHKRSTSDAVVVTNELFEYTAQGRLRDHYHQINGGPMERLTTNTYDHLGQLITKDVGGDPSLEDGLQKVNYSYNIRGWLTHINSLNHLEENPGQFADMFAFKINYNTVENTVGNSIKPLFNGNIAETFWQTESDGIIRKYGYQYDQLNRLQKAVYQKPEEAAQVTNSYNESLWYDKNGNITALQRSGEVDDYSYELVMDNLTYTYDNINKNRLTIVYDATNNSNGFRDDSQGTPDTTVDYGYDLYGNMTSDTNKGITQILYNHLNLPIKITFVNGIIEYLYNAQGVKVQKKITYGSTITTTDYQSGYQYKDGQLLFFPHAEGYVNVVEGNYFNYVYNYTDHLGNIRVSYGIEPSTQVLKILEENHYYPFGLKHNNYNVDKRTYDYINGGLIELPLVSYMDYKYKYNGKEWQDELGLNFYDYGARNYDAAIGRWMNIDPLAEQYRRWSTYNYCVNNPMRFVDPDGMGVNDVIIRGDLKKVAFEQLQSSTSLKLDMDNNGNVSVVGGESKNETDGLLKEAIESKNTVVEINATSSNSIGDKLIIGGSYEGSKTASAPSISNEVDGISNESVVASQVVNPNQATAIEGAAGLKKGTIMLHETLEAYIGANIDPAGNSYEGYEKAHDFVNGFENANTSTVAPSVIATKNQNGTYNVKVYVNGKPLYEVQNYSKNRKK